MKSRLCVAGVIYNRQGQILICQMPKDRGAYPGKWGLPGGGVEDGETMEQALEREVLEEVGLEIEQIEPLHFNDGFATKIKPGQEPQELYMMFLLFTARAKHTSLKLSEEFQDAAWIGLSEIDQYDLNSATRATFDQNQQQIALRSQVNISDYLQTQWQTHPLGKIEPGTVCQNCYRYNARNVVTNVIVWQGSKVLLIKRDIEPSKGFWALPGGYLDWNESVEMSAQRELLEETGISSTELTFFQVYSDPNQSTDDRQNVCLVFTTQVNQVELATNDEVQDIGWFDPDRLPERIAFNHHQIIREYTQTS